MTARPIVHVLIPSYNRRGALVDSVSSVLDSEGVDVRVLVVDDASTDGSVDAVRARFPSCEVVVNARNLGFAAGCNAGFTVLLERGAETIFLLNQDTRIAPDTLAVLHAFAAEHPRAGVVGPKTYSFDRSRDGRERLIYAGSWRGFLPLKQNIPGIEAVEEVPAHEPVRTDYVWGHGMLLRTSALRRTGGFDESFPMYYEDLDLCCRIRQAGFEIWCVPGAVMWHDQPDGSRAVQSEYWRWACKVRSTGVFHRKHYGLLASLVLSPLTILVDLLRLVRRRQGRAAWHLARAAVRRGLGLADPLRAKEVAA